jgi:type I restriction enzyme S subunit
MTIVDIVVLPGSSPKQQEFVRLLDDQFEVIEQNEWELDAALTRSEAPRQSILKRAFSGRLVPQDPTDEPASELLARIRVEQAASANHPKRSRGKILPPQRTLSHPVNKRRPPYDLLCQ